MAEMEKMDLRVYRLCPDKCHCEPCTEANRSAKSSHCRTMANITTSKILLIAVVFGLMSISTYGAALIALPVWWFLIGKIK